MYKRICLLIMILLTFSYINTIGAKAEGKTQENSEEMYISDKEKDYIQEVH